MRVTGPGVWGEPEDPAECRAVLARVVQLGVTFIDTADSYGPGISERLLAEALHPYPEDLVIATKGGLERGGPGDWRPNCRPEHLKEACEGSLRRLRTDVIDLYQLHTVDPDVRYEESIGALAELQEAGKIRHIGLSNVEVEHLTTARDIVEVVSVQNSYSVTRRVHEDVLRVCEEEGLAFVPFFPLRAGRLAVRGGPLDGIADRHGATPAQVALAWLLTRWTTTVPIPGTSSVAHLEENVKAADLALDEQDMDALEGLGGR